MKTLVQKVNELLVGKIKEVIPAVVPVVATIAILNFTLVKAPTVMFLQFLVGALAIIVGLIILLFGIRFAILPLGINMGSTFIRANKMWFIIISVFVLGFLINFAEPDVNVLAKQVSGITDGLISSFTIRGVVAIGAGILLMLGAIRLLKDFPLRTMLIISYSIAFGLAIFTSADFFAIAFDASGAATGAITVPLVLALSLGMASMKKDCTRIAEENTFGMVGLMASGAIFGVLILNFFIKTDDVTGMLNIYGKDNTSVWLPFFKEIPIVAIDTVSALAPIVLLFLFFQKTEFHLEARYFYRILIGFLCAFVGLVIFFAGVHAGFMNMGNLVGYTLANDYHKLLPIFLGAGLGMLIILTEPAVYVLTHKIQDVTKGYIKRRTVLIFLSIGMAFAVGLTMLKIFVPAIQLWHYLLPGFIFALTLTFFTPKLFTGISFDSGAVSSGPMTVTFILAYSQGVSEALPHADVLKDSFGIIAMVTMMPVISLQILGFIYKIKSQRAGGELRDPCQDPCCVPVVDESDDDEDESMVVHAPV